MSKRVSLNAYWRGGMWEITAWKGEEYLGSCSYLWHTKQDALRKARDTIKEEGGLGIFRKSWA